jgi:hypothetical protein
VASLGEFLAPTSGNRPIHDVEISKEEGNNDIDLLKRVNVMFGVG